MLATLSQPSVQQNTATVRNNRNNFRGAAGAGSGSGAGTNAGVGAGEDGDVKGNTVTTQGTELLWKKGKQIGEGSFGRVFQGMNTVTGEMLAIKQLVLADGSGEEVARLQKEIDVMEDLSHPHIVRYIATCKSDRFLYILLEYVTGGSIARILKQFGPIDEELLR